MTAYQYAMPAGIAGNLSRGDLNNVVEQKMIDAVTLTPAAYGVPVKLVSNKLQTLAVGDTAASVYGFLLRDYPIAGSFTTVNNAFGGAGLATTLPSGVLKSGYVNVFLNNFAAAPAVANGVVYVRIATAGANKPIGGIETAADSTNTIIVANAYFTGPSDSNGIAEIAYNV